MCVLCTWACALLSCVCVSVCVCDCEAGDGAVQVRRTICANWPTFGSTCVSLCALLITVLFLWGGGGNGFLCVYVSFSS